MAEFCNIYKEEFGEDISFAEAREISFKLIEFYELLSHKLPSMDR